MNTFAPVLDATVPVLLSAHSCVLSWWRAVHGTERRHLGSLPGARRARLCSRARGVVTPSRALLDELGRLVRAPVRLPG